MFSKLYSLTKYDASMLECQGTLDNINPDRKRKLGVCLLISIYHTRLRERLLNRQSAARFNMHYKAEPGKLDMKRQEPGLLYISLPAGSLFKLTVMA